MYEGKSLSVALLGDEVKREIDLSVVRHSEVKGDSLGIKRMDLQSGMLHVGLGNSSSGGGSGGEDSSSDEPAAVHHNRPTRHHRHSLPPKKYRLKESNEGTPSRVSSGFSSFRNEDDEQDRDGKDEDGGNMEDLNPDDDDCSGISHKDGRMEHSFTSGENSDSEMGGYGDGDDSSKQDGEDSGKKLFECDVCKMIFSNGANMRRHRMRHTGVKPFECRVCQKRFFRKDHLAEHMATHSKLLPFRCPICNKGFQRQIAMRAHFQNEHVGGSHDIVKACPLCTYKSGSMKSLRVHFYSRHGIDLDNPLPHSPSLQPSTNASPGSPGHSGSGGSGEYSELAQALGFEDRDKSSDSSLIPSHFLVPQIEISSNSPYPSHYSFTADSSYDLPDARHPSSNEDSSSSSPTNVSPKSNSSFNIPSSSDLVVVKREVLEVERGSPEQLTCTGNRPEEAKPKSSSLDIEDVQDAPEDLSSAGQSKSSFRLKLNPSSLVKISPLKSLLREDWRKDVSSCSRVFGTTNNSNSSSSKSNGNSNGRNSVTTGHTNLPSGYQVSEGEAITSSEMSIMTSESLQNRREQAFPNSIHQCIYCKIVFPDITLYFLHKGCHTDSSPWRCNICGETCYNVYDFNSHLLSKSHQ